MGPPALVQPGIEPATTVSYITSISPPAALPPRPRLPRSAALIRATFPPALPSFHRQAGSWEGERRFQFKTQTKSVPVRPLLFTGGVGGAPGWLGFDLRRVRNFRRVPPFARSCFPPLSSCLASEFDRTIRNLFPPARPFQSVLVRQSIKPGHIPSLMPFCEIKGGWKYSIKVVHITLDELQ